MNAETVTVWATFGGTTVARYHINGFVRSTKQYLKQSHIKKVQAEIKREEREALNISRNDDMGSDRELFTSALSFMDKQKERDSAQKTMYGANFK